MRRVLLSQFQICGFHVFPLLFEQNPSNVPVQEKFRVDPIVDEFHDQLTELKVQLEEFKRKKIISKKPDPRTFKTPTQSKIVRTLPRYDDEDFNQRFLESEPTPLYHLPKVRLGTLLETLESFVGLVSFKHVNPSYEPVTCVTAHINNISHLDYLNPFEEMTFMGKVIWAGSSSMKVHTWIYNEHEDYDNHPVAEATFTTVAKTMWPDEGAFLVPGIQPANQEERDLYSLTDNDQEYKQLIDHIRAFVSIDGVRSNKSFEDKIFEVYPNHKSIRSTTLKRSEKVYPGSRNSFGKVVAGVVLKQSYELARLSARMFSEAKPMLISMDDTAFIRPILVGGSVTYTASVVYSEEFTMMVRVNCEIIRDVENEIEEVPEGERDLVSVSHFMFTTLPIGLKNLGQKELLKHYRNSKELFPINETEALLHMEGERIHNLPKNQELLEIWNIGEF